MAERGTNMKKKVVALILTLSMLFSVLSVFQIFADAENNSYHSGNYIFNFSNSSDDVIKVTNGDVSGGKLSTKENKKPWNNLTAILNYKLESNKTYGYVIDGNVSGYSNKVGLQALLTMASSTKADTADSGILVGLYNPNNPKEWVLPKNGALQFKGEFKTGDLEGNNSYLALYLNDGTDAKFEFDKIKIFEIRTGDQNFDFKDGFDVFYLKNASIRGGKLSLKNDNGGEAEISAALNYRLQSNRTYSYEVKMSVTGGSDSKWVEPRWYITNPVNDSNNIITKMDGWGAKNGQTKTLKGDFSVGTISGNSNILKFYFWIANDYSYDIEYIKITEKEIKYDPNTSDYTFDFDVEKKDTVKITNGKVSGGKLVTKDGKKPYENLTAILNYKLESNKTYGYEIVGTVSGYSNKTWMGAFLTTASKTEADTKNGKLRNLYYADNMSGAFQPKNGALTFKGEFTTGELTEDNNYLALFLNDPTDAKFEFDSIKIYDATTYPVNSGDYTSSFDVAKKDTVKITNGKVSGGKLVTKDGKKPYENLTAILNYKLESNKTYGYEIVGTVSGYSNKTWMGAFLTTASKTEADTKNGKLRNLYYADNMSGAFQPKNGALTFKGEFTTGELTEDNNYLALFLNDPTDARFEFDYIKIYDATTYPVNEGNYTFEFIKEKKDLINSKNVVLSDGKLTLHNPSGTGAHIFAFLNYKLKNDKVYNYEFKLKVLNTGNGSYTQGAFYNSTDKGTDKKLAHFMPGSDELGNAIPVVGEYDIKGKFYTSELPEGKEYLSITFWDTSGAEFEIYSLKITETDKPAIKSGNVRISFDNSDDILNLSNASVSNNMLVLNNPEETGKGSRLMTIFNYQLKNDKTYTYNIKFRITNAGNTKYSQGSLFSASDSKVIGVKLAYFMPNCDNNGFAKPTVGDYLQKGMFTTDDLGQNNYLAVNFWDVSGATYEIEYIEIKEHEKAVMKTYTGSHTFDFENLADISSYSGNVEMDNGNLYLYGKNKQSEYGGNFVRLPFKLESNKTYAFEIKFTATEAKIDPAKNALFAFVYSNGKRNDGKTITFINSHYGWQKLRSGTETNSGIFRTKDINSDNEYLVIKTVDYSEQDIIIDYVTVKEVSLKNFSAKSHTFNFDDITEIDENAGPIQLPCRDPKTGENTLALKTTALGQGTFVRLPIAVEPFKYYQVSIDYRFDGDAADLGKTYLVLWPSYNTGAGKDGTFLYQNGTKRFANVFQVDEAQTTDKYQKITVNFSVTEEQIKGGQNYVSLAYMHDTDADAVLYIDKVTIKEVDKYDIAVMANIGSTEWSVPKANSADYQDWEKWDISDMDKTSQNNSKNSSGDTVNDSNMVTITVIIAAAVAVIGGISAFVIVKKKKKSKKA